MDPREIVVYDSPHPCPYLQGRIARLPLRLPGAILTPEQLDDRLADGDRRRGVFLYRPQCAPCQACEAIRLDVTTFHPNATQRRTRRRGDALLEVQIGQPIVDRERVTLFNAHRRLRGLSDGEDEWLDGSDYADFLANTCCPTMELSCWHAGRLVACAIADVGRQSLSAVYTFFDPAFRQLSLGTYSILREVQWCRDTGCRYLYLGFHIAESPHMCYKSRFRPHERRIGGRWVRFAGPTT